MSRTPGEARINEINLLLKRFNRLLAGVGEQNYSYGIRSCIRVLGERKREIRDQRQTERSAKGKSRERIFRTL